MLRSADMAASASTDVETFAALFDESMSTLALEINAESAIMDPSAVDALTSTMRVAVRDSPGSVAPDQRNATVPVPPGAGDVNVPPVLAIAETKVVPLGTTFEIETSVAGPVPKFVPTIVYVSVPLGATGSGVADSSIPRSTIAGAPTVFVAVALSFVAFGSDEPDAATNAVFEMTVP